MRKKLWILGLVAFITSCGSPNPGAWRVRSIEAASEGGCKYYWSDSPYRDDDTNYKIDSCGKWSVGDTLIFKSKNDEKNYFRKGDLIISDDSNVFSY